jgi:glycosyltransferase involved in cell wall biosynthesis
MGRVHEFETILGAARALRERSDIVFLFIGSGVQRALMVAAAQNEQLDNVTFQPYQARELLDQSLGAADVHLVSLRPRLEGLSVPSKIYGIAAAGRPAIFVGHPEGEVAHLIRSAGCGYCVPEGDVRALVASIVELAGDSARCSAMGRAARRTFDQHFAQQIAFAKWRSVLVAASPQRRYRERRAVARTA